MTQVYLIATRCHVSVCASHGPQLLARALRGVHGGSAARAALPPRPTCGGTGPPRPGPAGHARVSSACALRCARPPRPPPAWGPASPRPLGAGTGGSPAGSVAARPTAGAHVLAGSREVTVGGLSAARSPPPRQDPLLRQTGTPRSLEGRLIPQGGGLGPEPPTSPWLVAVSVPTTGVMSLSLRMTPAALPFSVPSGRTFWKTEPWQSRSPPAGHRPAGVWAISRHLR